MFSRNTALMFFLTVMVCHSSFWQYVASLVRKRKKSLVHLDYAAQSHAFGHALQSIKYLVPPQERRVPSGFSLMIFYLSLKKVFALNTSSSFVILSRRFSF